MKIIPSLLIASAALAGISQAVTVTELVTAAAGLCPELPDVVAANAATLGVVLEAVGDLEIIPALPSLEGQTISIFAPNDAAFTALLEETLGGAELADVDPKTVVDILKLHIAVSPTDSTIGVESLDGETVTIRKAANQVLTETTKAGLLAGPVPESCADIVNVFSIDQVLLPKAVVEALAAAGAPTPAPSKDDAIAPALAPIAEDIAATPMPAAMPTTAPTTAPAPAPAPAPGPTSGASSASFGVAAILAGVVALFA